MRPAEEETSSPTIALILPVFNERERIAEALRHAAGLGAREIIVVDGGSTDGTPEVLRGYPGVRCFRTAFPERAFQMNVGAFEAAAEVLLFAHVDTRFPPGALDAVRRAVREGHGFGGFCKRYDPPRWGLRLYAFFLNTWYLRGMRCLVGTNAMFVTRGLFEGIGGFPEVPFLEDVIFSDRLRRTGRPAVIAAPVVVGARRYIRNGILRQILRNMRVVLGHRWFHEDLTRLKAIYGGGAWEGGI